MSKPSKMSLKDVLGAARRQVAESPGWLKTIYKRNDALLELHRRTRRGEQRKEG